MIHHTLRAIVFAGLIAASSPDSTGQMTGYLSNQELQSALDNLARSSTLVTTSTIGTSLDGAPITLLTLGDPPNDSQEQPALLITAGIDARYLVSTEVALRVARNIIDHHPQILSSMTVYIIPRANPDGADRNLRMSTFSTPWNSRSTDDDRDRSTDEDGPEDLNGDGMITMMRRLDPPIEDPPTHLADPDDPRLNIKPDPKHDLRANMTLYVEGIDNDLDGQLNEDSAGGVDLDSNFMHDWPEFDAHSGRFPLSEPESKALATFVIDHPNIVMALTLGRHDNLVNQPDSKSKGITGVSPVAIDASDNEMYKAVGEQFKDATGISTAPKKDFAGSFHAWLYAQRGIPSFAAVPWTRPVSEKEESKDRNTIQDNRDDDQLTPSSYGDISQETIDELIILYESQTGESVDESMIPLVSPEMVEGFAAQHGVEIRRVESTEPKGNEPQGSNNKSDRKKSEDAEWLEYFDQTETQEFVNWEPFDHPTLGRVEIGGFKPMVKINPPSDRLDSSSEGITAFVTALIESRPSIRVMGPEINQLSDGLYEVRVSLVNEGKMPTSTAYSRAKRTIRPTVIRLSTTLDRIVSGQRVSRVWGIAGNGGRSDHHWIVRSSDIRSESIKIQDPRFGHQTLNLGN